MPDMTEYVSRGRFLKLCAAGAMGLAATFATACGGDEEDEEEEGGEDEEDEGGGLY